MHHTKENCYNHQVFCEWNIFTAIILSESFFFVCVFCVGSVCFPVSLETRIKPLPLNYSEISLKGLMKTVQTGFLKRQKCICAH